MSTTKYFQGTLHITLLFSAISQIFPGKFKSEHSFNMKAGDQMNLRTQRKS